MVPSEVVVLPLQQQQPEEAERMEVDPLPVQEKVESVPVIEESSQPMEVDRATEVVSPGST